MAIVYAPILYFHWSCSLLSLSKAICFLVLTLLANSHRGGVDAGCIEADLCCQGKDNSCVTDGPRDNGNNNFTCFCDSACAQLGDCCKDYRSKCKVMNCVLAKNWDEWGECDVKCGVGTKRRIRRVMQKPMNGGEPCQGPLIQKAVCEGTSCKVARAPGLADEIKETAKILPVSLGRWRRDKLYDPYRDIRKNLFERNGGDALSPDKRPSYCARFQLTEVRPGCHRHRDVSSSSGAPHVQPHQWTMNLTRGAVLCVECQSTAMQSKLGGRCYGHGAYLRETRWAAVTVPGCHGIWVMTSQREDCQCPASSAENGSNLSFILV